MCPSEVVLCRLSITVVAEVMPLSFLPLFLIWGTRVRRASEEHGSKMVEIETAPSCLLPLLVSPPFLTFLSAPSNYIYSIYICNACIYYM